MQKIVPKESLKKPKRYIILDSNIYSFYASRFWAKQLFPVLQGVVKDGYAIAISEISLCEILSGIPYGREQAALNNLNGMQNIPVDKDVFIAAAQLACFYKDDEFPVDQISLADRVIAATAFLTNSIVFTCDARDFPVPFFNQIKKIPLEYTQKGNTIFRYAYFLEPDLVVFSKYLLDRKSGGKSKKKHIS